MARFTAVDKATGKFTKQSTGHRFIAAPCVDANGSPTVGQACTLAAKTFRSCASSSCHASEAVARTLYVTDSVRIYQLIGSANSAITKVKAANSTACVLVAGKPFTSCLGAQFNVSLAQSPGAFVHNPFLLEQLLVASINQIQKDYGVTPSIGVSLVPQLILPSREQRANGSQR